MPNSVIITHQTIYNYRRAVRFGPHRLVLRPREGHDLQVENLHLEISPAFSLAWSRDVFGNSVATVSFEEEASELQIVSSVSIRRGELPKLPDRGQSGVGYPVVYDEQEMIMVSAYRAPIYPESSEILLEWSRHLLEETDSRDAVAMVTALNLAVGRAVQYRRREEKGVQSPEETIRVASGSCRDMATLLMEACRSLGIASRFSSGYLDCPASIAGIASTHAWAEVYFPGRGWTGFDPVLGEIAGRKHIAVGVSNHPRGVMPVSGLYFGQGNDFEGMKVAVKFEKSEHLVRTGRS